MSNVQILAATGIGVAFAAFVISRQVRRRPVTPRSLVVLPVWFLALSILADHRMVHRLDSASAVGFFAAGVAFAVAMGFARAATLRVWYTGTGPMCEGTWRTGALWAATIAVRVGLFALAATFGAHEGMGEAMVFVAMTLGVQNVLLARRAGLLSPARARSLVERSALVEQTALVEETV